MDSAVVGPENTRLGTAPPPRSARGALQLGILSLSFLVAVAITYGRALAAGSLELDGAGRRLIWMLVHLFFFGLAMGVASWIYHRLRRGQPLPAPRKLLGLALSNHALLLLALPFTSTDLYTNIVYARLASRGIGPGAVPAQHLAWGDPLRKLAPRWLGTPMSYGPVAHLLSLCVGWPRTLWGAIAAQKCLMFVFVAIAMLLAGGLTGWGAPAAHDFFYFSHNPLLAWETSGQGHNDAVLVACLLGFILAARAERPQLAVCLLTAAALLKATALPVLALYLIFIARRSWPRALWLALLSSIVAALIFSPLWKGLATLRGTFLQLGGDPTRHTRSFVDMFCYPARVFSGPELEALLFKIGLVITSVALLCVFLRSCRRLREPKDVFHSSLVVLFASCLLTPWSQPWYATWLLPFAMIDEARPWRDAIALYSVLSLVQYGAPADPYTYLAVNGLPLYVLLRAGRAPGAVRKPPLSERPA